MAEEPEYITELLVPNAEILSVYVNGSVGKAPNKLNTLDTSLPFASKLSAKILDTAVKFPFAVLALKRILPLPGSDPITPDCWNALAKLY